MTVVDPPVRATLATLVRRSIGLDVDSESMVAEQATGDALLRQARRDRVIPALASAVSDGAVEVSDEDARAIGDAWNATMRRCLSIDDRLVWLHDELATLGIDLRVLKGPASAHLDHRSPELRQYGDLDVLIRSDDLPRVFELLTGAGFERTFATPSTRYDRRYIKSASFRGDVEIDVHRTIADSPLGHRIPAAELWGPGEDFEVGGTPVTALSKEQRFVHACLHSHLGPPPTPLSSHADLAALLRRVDPRASAELARRWRLDGVVGAAVESTIAQLWWPTSLDAGWQSAAGGSVVDGLLVAAHRSPRSSSTIRTLLSLSTLPTWHDRVDFALELALPDRPYAANHPARVRQLVRSLMTAISPNRR